MKDFLTHHQEAQLRQQHHRERDGKIRDRIKAVLFADAGWTYQEIGEALLLHPDTVVQQVKEYAESSKLDMNYAGRAEKLTPEQALALEAEAERHLYAKTTDIAAWAKAQFGVEYTHQGMTEWLHRHGFSWKNPVGIPAKADPAKQKSFRRMYAKLRKSLPENEVIVFADAAHPTMATKIGKGWIRVGVKRPIETIASRTRVNVLGSLDLESMKFVGGAHETINAEALAVHFQQLREAFPSASKIHVILDRSGYNTCRKTKKEARRLVIKLHFLPPYSPNLNSIERLWKVASEHVRKNRVFASAPEFRQSILGFFTDTWPEIAQNMRGRINDNFQTLPKAISA